MPSVEEKNRVIKFRAWTGEQMVSPDYIDRYGRARWEENSVPERSDIVMQYTGLHDKNGVEIYEGDLLLYASSDDPKNFSCYEVFFHDGNANSDYNIGYSISRMHCHGNIAGGVIPSFKPRTTKQMIIIGNIYENHELLK